MILRPMLNLMRSSGAFDLVRIGYSHQALIVADHRFSTVGDELETTARVFSEQLEYLTAHYRIVPLAQLVEQLQNPGPRPAKLAAITIIDGCEDAFENAYPLLRFYKIPATLFVVSEIAGRHSWIWTDKSRYIYAAARRQQVTVTLGATELRVEIGTEQTRRKTANQINQSLKGVRSLFAMSHCIGLRKLSKCLFPIFLLLTGTRLTGKRPKKWPVMELKLAHTP